MRTCVLARNSLIVVGALGLSLGRSAGGSSEPASSAPIAARSSATEEAFVGSGRVLVSVPTVPPEPVAADSAPPMSSAPVAALLVEEPPAHAGSAWTPDVRVTSGQELFERQWSKSAGLGAPDFNAESCATCHRDPVAGGAGGNEFNVILVDGRGYGLGPREGSGRAPNGKEREELRAELVRHGLLGSGASDGQVAPGEPGAPAADAERILRLLLSEMQTPSLLGLGRIETIPDAEILLREDPEDRDGDGVRGVGRFVVVNGVPELGRFGWRAQAAHLADFACLALAGETGLTVPDQGRDFGITRDRDSAPDPEVSQEQLDDLASFLESLPAPEPGETAGTREAAWGRDVFDRIGCTACHVPALLGSDGPVPLYSDLLLHDVQPEQDRLLVGPLRRRRASRSQDEPAGLRTAPLWGIAGTAPYWHDGRAATLRDAVLAHDGEARAARERFAELTDEDARTLVEFLRSL